MCPSLTRLALVLALLAPLAVSRPVVADLVYAVSFSTGELIRYESANPADTRTTLLTGGSLVSPASMALGPDGNLYIGENGDGSTYAPRISKFEPDTLTLSTVFAFAAFEVFPGSLAFKGNDLLIGQNPFFPGTGPIVKLANATGGTLAVSDYTSGGNLAASPGLALAPDGRLYVSNQTYNSTTGIASGPVARFDTSGVFTSNLIADGADGLSGPTGLAISPDGATLYTASIMTGTILETNLATDATTAFASTGATFEVGPLALLSNGGLLAGSPSGNGSIYHFDTDGTLVGTFSSGLGQVGGIAAVPEPATISLVACGLLAAGSLLRRRRNSRA